MNLPDANQLPLQQGAVLGWNLAFTTGACAASYALVSPRFATALALGAVLEVMNFRGLFLSSRRIFFAGSEGANGFGPAVGAFGVRFLLLAAVMFVAIQAGLHPVGLVVGLSLIIPAVLVAAWRARPPIDPDAPVLPPDDPSWDGWNPWLAREITPDEDELAEADETETIESPEARP
ncbi:MAG: ATP synthase subunit I [Myxococcota bacterium]|nr:ATP synthase subunit I [Myxococcota bacterium]